MMRYLFGGILSLLLIACQGPSFDVCGSGFEAFEVQVVKSTTRLAGNSRKAAVEIYSHRPKGVSFGTGTAFKYKGEVIVVTAAHVLGGIDNKIIVATDAEETVAKIIYFDSVNDLAVLSIPELSSIKPMSLNPFKEKNLKIGQDVIYSGYPNVTGLLTIEGYIAGIHPRGDIYMRSYGWSGASGSAVFDMRGRLVGVLVAIDVGQGYVGFPTIIEDVVVVVPIWKLNFSLLESVLNI